MRAKSIALTLAVTATLGGLRIDLSGLRSGRAVQVGVRAVNAAGTGPIASVQGTPR